MQSLPRRLGVALVVAAIVAFLSIKLNTFRDYQIAEIAVEVTAVAGLTVLTGLSGQISLGNGAFMAIGAYTTALLLLHLNWPFVAALVAAAAVSAVTGAIVGVAAARLRGPYLAGATLMLGVALPSLAYAYPGLFGGDQGLNVIFTTPAFLGANFPLTRWQAWVSAVVAIVTLVLLANLSYSRIGRNWRAARDDEVAAALDGVNVAAARILAFVVSATCAGIAGALLAIVTGLVAPGAFTITLSISLVTAAVIGGLGSLPGALWGSLVIVLVPTYVTDVATSHGLSSSVGSNIPVAAYGAVLILVMLVFPQGIQGGLRRLLTLFTGPARTWRNAPSPDVLSSAEDARASQHEKRRHFMTRPHRLRWQAAAIMTVTALAAAACSSSSSSSSGSGSSSSSASSSAALTASAPGITATTITIGSHQPLTGPAAPGYSEIAPASTAYFDYVNAHGGVYGRKIIYKYLNDAYDPTTTASVVRQLVLQDNVYAIFNGLGTPTHLAVVNFLNAEKVPDVFVASGCECWNMPTTQPDDIRLADRLRARGQDPRAVREAALRGQEGGVLLPGRRVRPGRGQGPGRRDPGLDDRHQAELRRHQRQHRAAGRRAARLGRPGRRLVLHPRLHRAAQAEQPEAGL